MAELPAIEWPHPAGQRDSGARLIVPGRSAEGHTQKSCRPVKAYFTSTTCTAGAGTVPK